MIVRVSIFLLLLITSFPVFANGVYVGAGYGYTQHDSTTLNVDYKVNAEVEPTAYGGLVYAGYRFWDGELLLEVDYKDHGEVSGYIIDHGTVVATDYRISFKSYSLSAVGYLSFPGHEALKGSFRIGLSRISIKDGPTEYQNGNATNFLSLGFGIEYHFSNNVFIRLDNIVYLASFSYTFDTSEVPGYLGTETELSTSSGHVFATRGLSVGYKF